MPVGTPGNSPLREGGRCHAARRSAGDGCFGARPGRDRGGGGSRAYRRLAALAQDPRPDLADGRDVRDPRVRHRQPAGRPQPCPDRDPGGRPGEPRRDPRRPGRAWRLARPPRGREGRARRHPRRLPRWVLLDDQSADPDPPGRSLGRRGGSGDGLRDRRRPGAQAGPVRADDRRDDRDADRGRPRGAPGDPRRAASRGVALRLHGLGRLQREAQGRQPPRRGRHDPGHPGGRPEGLARRRPGHRPYRIGPARCPACPRGVGPGPLRRQRPGHPRHRTGALRDQPRRLDRPGRSHRARPRAPPPRHQHDPTSRRDQGGGRLGLAPIRDHVRVRPARASTWSSPARCATTAPCPRSSPTSVRSPAPHAEGAAGGRASP